jgi:hypothetical protein
LMTSSAVRPLAGLTALARGADWPAANGLHANKPMYASTVYTTLPCNCLTSAAPFTQPTLTYRKKWRDYERKSIEEPAQKRILGGG